MDDLTGKDTAINSGKRTPLESQLLPHMDFLYRIAYRFTGNREDAEDLVQDLIVKLYTQRQDLTGVAMLRSWLVRVLYRLFIDTTRKQKRLPLMLVKRKDSRDATDPLEKIPCEEPDPEEYAQKRLLKKSIERAMNMLGRDHRAIITLHDIEGYHLTELETLLEIPLGTLKSRLHRARAKLKEILKKDGTF